MQKAAEWMPLSLLLLHQLLLRHRCQATLSVGKQQSAGHVRPVSWTRGLLNASRDEAEDTCFLLFGYRVGWLGSSQRQNTLPKSSETLYVIQQSPPEVPIIATYSLKTYA